MTGTSKLTALSPFVVYSCFVMNVLLFVLIVRVIILVHCYIYQFHQMLVFSHLTTNSGLRCCGLGLRFRPQSETQYF